MELGLLFLAIVVFSWWYDNLYEFVPTKHKKNPIFACPQQRVILQRMVIVIDQTTAISSVIYDNSMVL